MVGTFICKMIMEQYKKYVSSFNLKLPKFMTKRKTVSFN